MSKTYLLVAEGPSDHAVIQKMADSMSEKLGTVVTIRLLAPEVDATTQKHVPHGWGGVRSWCQKHKLLSEEELERIHPSLRLVRTRQHWKHLLKFAGASGLIVQLDSDIAEDLGFSGGAPKSKERSAYCDAMVRQWLGEHAHGQDLHVSISTFSLETWILATWDRSERVFSDLPGDFDFEDIADAEDRLLTLGLKGKTHKGRRRLKKSTEYYEIYGERVRQKLSTVREECQAADNLCRYISG